MLTGDNTPTARAIAAQVGIDEARGDQLPEDKLAAIERLSPAGKVGMVGDGINDAPALARADIGFAMGAAGTGTAIETADVALMDDDSARSACSAPVARTHTCWCRTSRWRWASRPCSWCCRHDRHALWMAVFADVGASLLVVANGLRLLRAACPGRRARPAPVPGHRFGSQALDAEAREYLADLLVLCRQQRVARSFAGAWRPRATDPRSSPAPRPDKQLAARRGGSAGAWHSA